MAWQRRIVEFPDKEDLTKLQPGTKIVWSEREIILCPNCKRPGARIGDLAGECVVVHVTDANRDAHEACFGGVVEGAADIVTIDPEGRTISVIHTTEKKPPGGSNN